MASRMFAPNDKGIDLELKKKIVNISKGVIITFMQRNPKYFVIFPSVFILTKMIVESSNGLITWTDKPWTVT